MAPKVYRSAVHMFAGQMSGTSTPVAASAGSVKPGSDTAAKLSPESVSYRPANCCEVCHFFTGTDEEDSGTCQIVSGMIDGDAICNRFESKSPSRGSMLAMW